MMREKRKAGGDWMLKQPGPRPGSLKAIPEQKAIAMGFASPETPRRTKTNQKNGETGETKAPGFTQRR